VRLRPKELARVAGQWPNFTGIIIKFKNQLKYRHSMLTTVGLILEWDLNHDEM